jgi:hypothetical protein
LWLPVLALALRFDRISGPRHGAGVPVVVASLVVRHHERSPRSTAGDGDSPAFPSSSGSSPRSPSGRS